MPRNGTGTFSLVSGNPVVSGTTIESNWANTTLSDIATTLTDSLSRSGQGGMTAALRIADGTQGAPGVGFANETGSGFYRAGTGEVWAVVQGAQTLNLDANGVYVPADKTTTVDGAFVFNEAGADKDARFEGDTDANLLFTDASTDRVGIGTATPASKLDVVGDVTVSGAVNAGSVNATTLDLTNLEVTNIKAKDGTASASIADSTGVMSLVANPVLSGGTANGVLYLNGSKVATSGSALTFDGLNALALGSGGSTNTATSVTLNATDNAANGGYILGKRNGTNAWLLGDTASALGSGTGFTSYNYGTAPWIWYLQTGGEQMRLTSTGLGIGTSSPGAKLDVQGALGSLLGQFFETSSGQNRRIRFSISSNVSTIESTATTGSTNLAFAVDGFERMRIDSSGNLGIGTSSPAGKVDAVSNAYAAFTARSSTSGAGQTVDALKAVDSAAANFANAVYSATSHIWNYTGVTEGMRLDSSGNLGLGVTPSAWWSAIKPLQMSGNGFIGSASNFTYVGANFFYDSSANPVYVASAAASLYEQGTGAHKWYTAPSGTAGNAISFTQAMTLDASGNLGVGTTSPTSGFRLDIQATTARQRIESTTGTNQVEQRLTNTGGTLYLALDNSTGSGFGAAYGAVLWHTGNYPMLFATNNTERARITSGGDLLVGTTTDSGYHRLNKSNTSDWVVAFTNASATTPWGVVLNYSAAAPNNTSSAISFSDTGGERATIRNNGGLANYSANDVNLSDRREKTNFAPAKSYLDTICAIPVQTFNYIDQSEDDPGLTLGVVAQDVQAVAPELVMESNWGTEDSPKMRLSIYQTDLQYALMKALQELKAEFDAYKATHP